MAVTPCLGEGTFGTVYRIDLPDPSPTNPTQTRDVVVKVIRANSASSAIRESDILKGLHHENIIHFYGYLVDDTGDGSHMLVLESMTTSIRKKLDAMATNPDRFNEYPLNARIQALFDAANGLTYLHTRSPRVIHRDIKADNLLINGIGVVKICDFGTAKEVQGGDTGRAGTAGGIGTYYWMAPEVYPDPRRRVAPVYTVMCDVFSYAMTIYEVSNCFFVHDHVCYLDW